MLGITATVRGVRDHRDGGCCGIRVGRLGEDIDATSKPGERGRPGERATNDGIGLGG